MEPLPSASHPPVRRTDPLLEHMTALLAGRAEALRSIYDATSERVHGLALRMAGEPALAQEITVETFVRAWRRAATFDPARGDALGWLLAIARSTALDALRTARKRSARLAHESSLESFPADERSAAARGAESSERGAAIRKALRELPDEQRSVLALAFWEGLTHAAIAERLGLPLGTVKTRSRLALARLRRILRSLEAP